MTGSCVSSLSRAGLSACAAVALALPWLAATALGQTGTSKSGDDPAKPRSEYLNDGVYKIVILRHYYDLTKPTLRFSLSGLLVRTPNVILTAQRSDLSDNANLFEENSHTSLIWVCEQSPDPVRLANEKKRLEEEKTKVSDEDLSRFKEATGNKQAAKKEKPEERQKNNSSDLAEKEQCVVATVKKVDNARSLVLLEATEKLRGEVPMLNVSDPDPGTQVRAFGFPTAAEYNTRRSTAEERSRARLIPTITFGSVVKTITDAKEGQIIIHQVPVSSGAWGGPVVNNCNQVVGLNTGTKSERVVKVEGTGKVTGKNKGQLEVGTASIPTSSVAEALGAKELKTFLELNGYGLTTDAALCTAALATSFTAQLQQNVWNLFIGGSALLLATAAMVIAMRRPGPVRNTITKIFPGRARARHSGTEPQGYREGYSGAGSHRPSDYMSDTARTDAYAARPAPAALRADPTNLMPAYAGGGARLVPIAGGQTLTLDPGKLAGSGVTFGRESDCDIKCDHSTVSKQHARITRTSNGKLQIEDLGSANGTWRGRSRIQREAFGGGDIVRFGAVEYRVELLGNGANSTLLMPSVSWELSGLEEGGRAVQWHLQPTVDGSGRQVETTWIIGRSNEGADLVLPDKRISNQHAKIRFTPQRGLEICDLGSSNGTKVDGRKVTDSFVAITDAHQIEFGGSKMSMNKR
jgi:pSer/pThr/pTyr-binding forkhead associated (FHA) protein